MKFNERLYRLREENSMSKTDLAEILGTTRQMVTRYEAGISTATIDILLSEANHFKVFADYLLGRDDYTTLPKDKGEKYMMFPNELTDEDVEFVQDMILLIYKKRRKA